ncbi:hypothetical protein [Edaphobacter bradus]|uniref:hypothetical protein n=1 Tax=Edaphobacter bradus TaxID=2259016 RepID=UPI0021E00FA3|nr:hypothetical protein [Edaphobacter bradus]
MFGRISNTRSAEIKVSVERQLALELHNLAQFEDADRVQNVLPFIEEPIIMFSANQSETRENPSLHLHFSVGLNFGERDETSDGNLTKYSTTKSWRGTGLGANCTSRPGPAARRI